MDDVSKERLRQGFINLGNNLKRIGEHANTRRKELEIKEKADKLAERVAKMKFKSSPKRNYSNLGFKFNPPRF